MNLIGYSCINFDRERKEDDCMFLNHCACNSSFSVILVPNSSQSEFWRISNIYLSGSWSITIWWIVLSCRTAPYPTHTHYDQTIVGYNMKLYQYPSDYNLLNAYMGITDTKSIGHRHPTITHNIPQYPTMHYLGIPRYSQSKLAYKLLTEYFREIPVQITLWQSC